MRIAVLDIGSSSIKLLIAEVLPSKEFKILLDEQRVSFLGESLGNSDVISEKSITVLLDLLAEEMKLIEQFKADKIVAVATMSLRIAKNAKEILELVKRNLKLEIVILDSREEGKFAAKAVMTAKPYEDSLVVDIGGASSEIVQVTKGQVKEVFSCPFGSLIFLSNVFKKEYISENFKLQKMKNSVISNYKKQISNFLNKIEIPHGIHCVGVGGAVTTLASVYLSLKDFDKDKIDGLKLYREEINRQLSMYLHLSLSKREKLPGMNKSRAGLIVGGVFLLHMVLSYYEIPFLEVATLGVRHGLLLKEIENL